MPGGAKKQQAYKQYTARKAGFDKTNCRINRINAFNVHKMYPEMAREFVKLHDAVKGVLANQSKTQSNNAISEITSAQYKGILEGRVSQNIINHPKGDSDSNLTILPKGFYSFTSNYLAKQHMKLLHPTSDFEGEYLFA